MGMPTSITPAFLILRAWSDIGNLAFDDESVNIRISYCSCIYSEKHWLRMLKRKASPALILGAGL